VPKDSVLACVFSRLVSISLKTLRKFFTDACRCLTDVGCTLTHSCCNFAEVCCVFADSWFVFAGVCCVFPEPTHACRLSENERADLLLCASGYGGICWRCLRGLLRVLRPSFLPNSAVSSARARRVLLTSAAPASAFLPSQPRIWVAEGARPCLSV
jgi:hypothetical protein